MSDDRPNVHLALENQPENVTLVRAMLSGLAEPLALSDELLDDVKTAVSEAANNVVLHAYDGGRGPLEVSVYALARGLEVIVRDRGEGIRPRPTGDDQIQGIGLSVIQALTDRASFRGGTNGEGTEVRMEFGVGPQLRVAGEEAPAPRAADAAPAGAPRGDATVSVGPVALLDGVLGRLASAFAARASFSVDRLSDTLLVTDMLAAQVPGAASGDHVAFSLSATRLRVDLEIGPLRLGTGAQIIDEPAAPGLDPIVGKLADAVQIKSGSDGELLSIVIEDRRAG